MENFTWEERDRIVMDNGMCPFCLMYMSGEVFFGKGTDQSPLQGVWMQGRAHQVATWHPEYEKHNCEHCKVEEAEKDSMINVLPWDTARRGGWPLIAYFDREALEDGRVHFANVTLKD
jgi:hypothetical protein